MSGNYITEIENMNICPCCKNPTIIQNIEVLYKDKQPLLSISFTHKPTQEKDYRRLDTECECFSESGGYWVYVLLKEDIKQVSQEWY